MTYSDDWGVGLGLYEIALLLYKRRPIVKLGLGFAMWDKVSRLSFLGLSYICLKNVLNLYLNDLQ